jgi:glutamate synthase (NADPH/NADH) small chain
MTCQAKHSMATPGDTTPRSTCFAEIHPPIAPTDAVAEAERCLQCGGPLEPAPCVAACPAEIDVPRFIHEIKAGRPVDAGRTVFGANVLGGTCARVCPVEELCEGSCVLHREGRRAIAIGRLQRFATDNLLQVDPKSNHAGARANGPSIGVIGAGPAGLACAAELAARGYRVVVYERRPVPGGLVTYGVAPYKQWTDPIPAEVERIRRLGVEFQFGVTVGNGVSIEALGTRHRAIFVGAGMGDDQAARIPGEDLSGVWESLGFIERLKLAGPQGLLIGPRVAVIGGGNTAIDVAREAVRLGAQPVLMLYRRTELQMPAHKHEIAAARREGVRIVPLTAPLAFLGDDRVRAVRCVKMKLGAPEPSGRPRPEPVPGSEHVIEVDTVIKAIGQRPLSELFAHLGLELQAGVLPVDADFQTARPGVYAGGDCVNGGGTVVEAVRQGKLAAAAIHRRLAGLPRLEPPDPAPARVETDDRVVRHFQAEYELDTLPAYCKGCNLCVQSCPSRILALNSSNRIVVSNVNQCVFCGLCEMRCPDFAIWIVKRPQHAEELLAGPRE